MPQFLIAGYLPDDFDPSSVTEEMGRAIHALNKEMGATGVLKLACGLGAAKSLAEIGEIGEIGKLGTDGMFPSFSNEWSLVNVRSVPCFLCLVSRN